MINLAERTEMESGAGLHMNQYGNSRLPFRSVGAEGVTLRLEHAGDPRGEAFKVIDASDGYASACLGANHPLLSKILPAALKSGYATDEVEDASRQEFLAQVFGEDGLWTDHFPFGCYHVAGRNSGSEGVELAVRLLAESRFDYRRQRLRDEFKDRDIILAFEGAWHGWTAGVAPLLNRRHYRIGLMPAADAAAYGLKVSWIPFGDFNALRQFFEENGERLLGVVVEPLQGDAGILCPPRGYLRELADLTRNAGALLVADEVLTFAKTGRFFSMRDESGAIPTDITVIGKSLGIGLVSVSLVIARRDLAVRPRGAVCTSDLRSFTCRVMSEGCCYLHEQGLVTGAHERGLLLRGLLQEHLVTRFPEVFAEVRGLGLLNGMELTAEAAPHLGDLRVELIRAGVYVEVMAGAGRRSRGLRYVYPTLRFAPPLVIKEEEIRQLVERAVVGTLAFTGGRL
jgi:acetylornithine/N-succinyldiaminopimelate aminotransferase